MTPEDLSRLQGLAEKAAGTSNPGDWWSAESLGEDGRLNESAQFQADRDFIEACSPDVVLSLVAEVKALRALRAAWKTTRCEMRHEFRCESLSATGRTLRDADWKDPRCDCGLREIVAGLEES